MTTSEGFRYVLTIIDRYTNLPEAIPLKDFTTKNVVKSARVIKGDSSRENYKGINGNLKNCSEFVYHPERNRKIEPPIVFQSSSFGSFK